jgi:hypothetical protein
MPIDYGLDLACVTDLSEEMRTTDDPRLILGEALVRRWSTPRGMLLDDEDYGTDLAEFINDDVDALGLARIRAEARSEALKDERVINCTVASSTWDAQTETLYLAFSIDAVELGTVTLKIAVTDVTVELLSVE